MAATAKKKTSKKSTSAKKAKAGAKGGHALRGRKKSTVSKSTKMAA
jgi:hypothetical protein